MSVTVHFKDAAKERIILDTLKAYENLYPARFKWFGRMLENARQVSSANYKALGGRSVDVTMRVPTEPFLFLQALMPDFGKDSADIELLVKLWGDYARNSRDRRQRTVVFDGNEWKRNKSAQEPPPHDSSA